MSAEVVDWDKEEVPVLTWQEWGWLHNDSAESLPYLSADSSGDGGQSD
jgi:hypothetical protein